MTRLDGDIALVTGGSRGLGRAMAEALARAGASTVVAARSDDQVQDVARSLRDGGYDAHGMSCDVTQPDQIDELVARVAETVGPPTIVVNNAGNLHFGPLVPIPGFSPAGLERFPQFERGTTDEEWYQTIDTHLTSAVRLLRAVGPSMLAGGHGRVINVTSVSVGRPARFTIPYDCAKAGLIGLTRSLAKEWARHGITVNAISPGQFQTDLSAEMHADPRGREWMLSRIPMRRTADPEEIGPLCVYLASREASFVTGQVYAIDGGESL